MYRFAGKTTVAILVVTLAAAFAACNNGKSAGGGGNKDTAVAATVNGKNISLKDVDQSISQQTGGQQAKLSPLELANARLQSLQGLIQEEVLFQRAEKEKLLPRDEEVAQEISARKQQARLTEEEWQRRLGEGGETEQSLRDKIRRDLAIQKLLDKTVGQISIRENEVVDFFNTNSEKFVTPRGVSLSAIVADPLDGGGQYQEDARSEAEAQSKINSIHAQLKSGTADFASIARARSEDPSAARGGDLGFATEDQLRQLRIPQEVVSSLFGSMQPGGFTNPVRLEDGRYSIFKLTDRRLQSEKQTIDSPGVKDQIKDLLISARQRILNNALGVVAMNEAKIENHIAQNMLTDPSLLGGMQPISPGLPTGQTTGQATPAASAPSPASSPAASATASPQAR